MRCCCKKKAVTFQDSLTLEKYFLSYVEDSISICIWSLELSKQELLSVLAIPRILNKQEGHEPLCLGLSDIKQQLDVLLRLRFCMIWKSQIEYSTNEKKTKMLEFLGFFFRNVISEEKLKEVYVNTEKRSEELNERKVRTQE